jgi:hypothetical protein
MPRARWLDATLALQMRRTGEEGNWLGLASAPFGIIWYESYQGSHITTCTIESWVASSVCGPGKGQLVVIQVSWSAI